MSVGQEKSQVVVQNLVNGRASLWAGKGGTEVGRCGGHAIVNNVLRMRTNYTCLVAAVYRGACAQRAWAGDLPGINIVCAS